MYIGRNIDSINNISTLDNLSFNGSDATFNLTQNSVAFVPVSADALQIQIDGVIQANNFTISGSTLTFDFTPNSGSVCNSVKHFGVGLLTTVSDGAVTTAKLGADAVTTAKINDGAVTSSKIASGVIPTSRPNATPLVYNGDCAIAQRGTSQTGVSSGANYPVDRFQLYPTNLGAYTITQEALTSGNAFDNGFRTALRIDTTTADASPSSTDYLILAQKFEGQDLQVIKKGSSNAEKLTLSFWVKSNKTTTGQVNLFEYQNNRLVSGTYTVSVANTWEKKIINFPADTTGAFTNSNVVSLGIEWFLDSGSNFSSGTAPTSWEAQSNGDRNANNFALASSTANDFAITGVQLEVGEFSSTTIPPFEFESFDNNLERCQRYFFKNNSVANMPMASGVCNGTTNARAVYYFPKTMRANPSLDKSSSTDFKVQIGGSVHDTTNVAFYYQNLNQALLYADVSSGLTDGKGCLVIDDGGSNIFISGSAEL
ncbi:hypothetical protein OAP76_00795 [Alphaproteobacteria bacterium]|nr:hypothetical protein [Alphaproteobacteria bacterium]